MDDSSRDAPPDRDNVAETRPSGEVVLAVAAIGSMAVVAAMWLYALTHAPGLFFLAAFSWLLYALMWRAGCWAARGSFLVRWTVITVALANIPVHCLVLEDYIFRLYTTWSCGSPFVGPLFASCASGVFFLGLGSVRAAWSKRTAGGNAHSGAADEPTSPGPRCIRPD